MRTATGLVTDFTVTKTVMSAEERRLVNLKEATGQMRGAEVINHLPFDPNDHDVQQYVWESHV